MDFYAWPFDGCFVDDERVTPQPGNFYSGWISSDVALSRERRAPACGDGRAVGEVAVAFIFDARLCSRRRHRIQTPYGEIQRSGERNPRKVGHEQQRGDDVDRIEKHDGRDDGHPDHNDINEAEIGAVQTEEERRPRGIENELQGIDRQGQAGAGEAGFPPDQPPCNRNHQIEDGPHRREKPVRRPPGRLL